MFIRLYTVFINQLVYKGILGKKTTNLSEKSKKKQGKSHTKFVLGKKSFK